MPGPRRALTWSGWALVWIVAFWGFFLAGFPRETAKAWLVEQLGRSLHASVSIDALRLGWTLDVRLEGISAAQPGFAMRLDSLTIVPRISSLLWREPRIDFDGHTSSGGHLAGSYRSDEVTLFFQDVSFKDLAIASLTVPSATIMKGSGRFRIVTRTGTIETEVDGVPGGRQRLTAPGGAGPGLDGKLKITLSLPKP